MNRGSAKTIAPRIRISLYGDESARCSDSNRLDLPSASSTCRLLPMAKRGCGSLSAQPWLHPGLDPPWVAVVCHALDDQGLYWFEEPIAYDNLASYAQLARELKTPVQLGENFYGPRSLFQTIREKSGDYVMFDLMRIGGVTGWLQAAAIAGAAGIEVSTHLYPEVAAHFVRLATAGTRGFPFIKAHSPAVGNFDLWRGRTPSTDEHRPGANQMRQHPSFREHFRRGNASSHPDRRATIIGRYRSIRPHGSPRSAIGGMWR